MTAYNVIDFEPPAPVASVSLRHSTSDVILTDVPMQLDTGADVSLVPQWATDQLGVSILTDVVYELAGFDGSVSQAFAVELRIVFCGRIFRGKFLLTNQPIGVIGRDVLNLIPLLFDGPQLDWSEFHSST